MRPGQRGLSLIELAIVLLVAALLAASLLTPLAAQNEARKIDQTRRSLDEARNALLGFALAHGRLPCPASASSLGREAGGGAAACSSGGLGVADGYLPAATLSLSPTDGQGYSLDAWGARLRYAVSVGPAGAHSFTSSAGISTYWQAHQTPPLADLQICSAAANISHAGTAGADCAAANALSREAPAVLYAIGRHAADSAPGVDSAANRDGDRVFVFHEARSAAGAGGRFEDVVLWLSTSVLYNRMVAAGRLP